MPKKTVTSLAEAKAHFAESQEPVDCTQEGQSPAEAKSLEEATAYFGESSDEASASSNQETGTDEAKEDDGDGA